MSSLLQCSKAIHCCTTAFGVVTCVAGVKNPEHLIQRSNREVSMTLVDSSISLSLPSVDALAKAPVENPLTGAIGREDHVHIPEYEFGATNVIDKVR